MSSYLPCGVTDKMCEPYDPYCGNCGHKYSDHLDDDDYLYDSNGMVVSVCGLKKCYCSEFGDFEYEPDWERDD